MPDSYGCPKCRVPLKHIVGNMWKCSKCGTVYWDKGFMAKEDREDVQCSHCGSRRFRRIGAELICVLCGLVQ
ncbi:hypothetical protein MUP37_01000 [Candidatus Bathyarchaeota archaeon]|nr:hypothetical protein [Candidatus Bathyarchaeota archaeon]